MDAKSKIRGEEERALPTAPESLKRSSSINTKLTGIPLLKSRNAEECRRPRREGGLKGKEHGRKEPGAARSPIQTSMRMSRPAAAGALRSGRHGSGKSEDGVPEVYAVAGESDTYHSMRGAPGRELSSVPLTPNAQAINAQGQDFFQVPDAPSRVSESGGKDRRLTPQMGHFPAESWDLKQAPNMFAQPPCFGLEHPSAEQQQAGPGD